jgi:mRNA-degrading endonuclease RelE of RelBE toxin-antitoxin system
VTVTVRISKSFTVAVKPLLKKYPSLSKDLQNLEKALLLNPREGTPLGHGAYKIRLKIASKGKGKSGGARVISLLESTIIGEVQIKDAMVIVNLITIYDKADTGSISDKELKDLIKDFHLNS